MRNTSHKYVCANCGSPASRSGDGLGTWRCSGKCPYVHFATVNRFTGSGKESEQRQIEAVHVMRHIRVKVQ